MKSKKKKIIVLLDSHAILHRAYHAMSNFSTKDGRPTGALYGFVSMVIRINEMFRPEHIIACFDLPKPTFRHIAYDGYKGARTKTEDALILQIKEAERVARELSLPVYSLEGYEADDMLGTICEQMKDNKEYEIIIASGDMDTLQLVKDGKVSVYTLRKANEGKVFHEEDVLEKYQLTPEQVKDYKGLAGDPSDNIVGVPGIGEKTATALLKEYKSLENIYKVLKKDASDLQEKGFKERVINLLKEYEEEALFSKTLATIHRTAPITFTIPEKKWEESLEKEKWEAICDEFEFKQLKSKLHIIHENNGTDAAAYTEGAKEEEAEFIPKEKVEELKVMAHLLSSEDTNPSQEKIEIISGKRTYEEIKEALTVKLREEELLTLYEAVERPISEIVIVMEEKGIKLDTDFLKKLSEELHTELTELEKTIHKEAGEDFTINSPKQLGVILYEKLGLGTKIKKTKTGNLSTNAEQLESMQGEHAIIPLILKYRELSKLLSTYIDSLPTYVKEDGRIHAHFVQTGAGTGRFSCEEPNLQNLPVKTELGKKVREAFIAEKGNVLISCDYAQIDLRSAAILSGDKELVHIFKEGIDVHTGTAMKMFHVRKEEVTDTMRRRAKAINFGILYGMGVTALKDGLKVERKEAQEYFDTYKKTFARLTEYLEEVKAFAFSKGYTETLLKRRRQVPLLKSPLPFLRAQGERIAINAPIQGTSADILKLGMIDAYEYVKTVNKEKGEGSLELLLQIHDELVFEVKEECASECGEAIAKILEAVLEKRNISQIPLVVSRSVGPNLKSL
jgi:DNA polymerase-1